MADTYVCNVCRETFTKAWSDEEADDELRARFPGVDVTECELVCDDCDKLVMDWLYRPRGAN